MHPTRLSYRLISNLSRIVRRFTVVLPNPNSPRRDEVLLLHADQIATFGGTAGVQDQGLLDSALAQPQATFGCELLHPTLAD